MADHVNHGGVPTDRVAALIPRRLWGSRRTGGARTCRGAVLFADIAGFTALTERLRRTSGERGVEELTNRLNATFSRMVSVVADCGGDVLKFGGDALLVAFDRIKPGETTYLEQTIRCADHLQRVVRAAHRGRGHTLSLHIGIACGEWTEVVVGTAGVRREQFVYGPAVTSVLKAASLARRGGCVLIAGARQLPANSPVRFRRCGPGHWQVAFPRREWPAPRPPARDAARVTVSHVDFVPTRLRSLISQKGLDPLRHGEHRRVSTLFIFWRGYGIGRRAAAVPLKLWSDVFAIAHRAGERTHGLWARSDPGDDYHKLLILFGAPTASEGDVDHAVEAARIIRDGLVELRTSYPKLKVGLGLTTATVYTGFVGGADRFEFTAMGDGVNLAARLAAKAPHGHILVDSTTRREAGEWRFAKGPVLSVKGVRDPVGTFRPVGRAVIACGHAIHSDIVEYPDALERAQSRWCEHGGRPLCIDLWPGADGRRFVRQLLERLGVPVPAVEHFRFEADDSAHPHGGLQRYLRSLLQRRRDTDSASTGPGSVGKRPMPPRPKELSVPESLAPIFASERLLAARITTVGPKAWADMVAGLVWNSGLPGGVQSGTTALILEDFQHASAIDRDVFLMLAQREVETRRYVILKRVDGSQPRASDDRAIVLGAVSRDELRLVLRQVLPAGQLPSHVVDYLYERSQGMPGLGCLYAEYLRANGYLCQPRETGGLWRANDLASAGLPETLRAHYIGQVDRLPTQAAELAGTLAVLGDSAPRETVRDLYERQVTDADFRRTLQHLIESGLVEEHVRAEGAFLSFADPACRNAVYDTMSFAVREALHQRAARYWSRRGRGGQGRAAEHRFLARDAACVKALLNAGRRARRLWLLERARRLLKWSLLAATGRYDPAYSRITPPLPRLLDNLHRPILEALAETLQVQGEYKDSARLYRSLARDAACRKDDKKECDYRLALARLNWIAGQYPETCRQGARVRRQGDKAGLTDIVAKADLLLGEAFRRTGRLQKAQHSLERAVTAFTALEDRDLTADALNALGLVHWNRGRIETAGDCFRRALRILPRQRPTKRGRIANNLGILFEENGSLNAAQQYYRKAFETFDRLGLRRERSYCLGNLANLYRHGARYERARDAYERVELELRSIGEAHAAAYTRGNIGELWFEFGDVGRALDCYRWTHRFAKRVGDNELIAECLGRLAQVDLFRRCYRQAEHHINKARHTAERAHSAEFQLRADLIGAELLLIRADANAAMAAFERCREQAVTGGFVYYRLWAMYGKGRCLLRCRQYRLSHDLAGKVWRLARKTGYRWWELRGAVLATEVCQETDARAPRRDALSPWVKRAFSLYTDIENSIGDPSVKKAFQCLPVGIALRNIRNRRSTPDTVIP